MAKKKKGLFGAIGSLLGSVPVVGKVKKAAKSVKKKAKAAKKKVKKAVKKAKKKLKKKIGKVFTKARKIKNNLSKSKLVKKIKRTVKKAVIKTKKAVKKAKAVAKSVKQKTKKAVQQVKQTAKKTVQQTKQQLKTVVKETKKAATKVGGKVATAYTSFKEGGYKEVLSVAVDFIPVVGNAKSAYEAIVGKDPITGRKLEDWERKVAAAGILAGPAAKVVKHGGKLVAGVVKNTSPAVAKNVEKLTNALENVRSSLSFPRPTVQLATVSGVGKRQNQSPVGKSVANSSGGKKANKEPSKTSDTKPLVEKGQQFTNGRKNKLKPNIKYKTGEYDYLYETDDLGRISKFETDSLQLTKREKRLPHSKNTPGKVKGQDHAGHLVGDRFGGSPKIDNLVSQLSDVNLKQYKKLENEWAEALKANPPKKVEIDIEIKYEKDNKRPTEFIVKYWIDGKYNKNEILN